MNVEEILELIKQKLAEAGFSDEVCLVGGAVRDQLLGLEVSHDLDFVTDGSAQEIVKILYESGASSRPPSFFPRFQTSSIGLGDYELEFVTARRESYQVDSRKPNVEPGTFQEDAMRRDFTINALMQNIESGEIKDFTGFGLSDLESKILRTPRDAEETFFDDPLRMLRAIRFRWQLGFEYGPGLFEAIQSQADRLDSISSERIRDEFIKMVSRSTATNALRDLFESGLLAKFLPELISMKGVTQGKYHHLDVWDHTLLVIDNLFRNCSGEGLFPSLRLVLSGLFHDVGKPGTRFVDDRGDIRFFGHETVGAEMTKSALVRLKLPHSDADEVAKLVKNHMRLGSSKNFTNSAARRLVRDMGQLLDDLFVLVKADQEALKPGVETFDLEQVKSMISKVEVESKGHGFESPLTGSDIINILGLKEGPEIGFIKNWLLEKVIEGSLLAGDVESAKELLVLHKLELLQFKIKAKKS